MERLTGLDAGFLYMETPALHMHTLKIAVLDPAPGVDELPIEWVREQIGQRLHLLPPFTRRLVELPGRFHHPVWIEDPDFDIRDHVRSQTVPSPGTQREMDEVIAEIASRPLDRRRPLWEMYLLEGLEDGRIAVLVKIHHAAADGVAASALLANVMTTIAEASTSVAPPAAPRRTEPVPTTRQLLLDAFFDHVRQFFRLPALLLRTVRNLVALIRRRRASDVRLPRPMLDTPRTSFNGALTPRRSFATTSLRLDAVKRVKEAFGVTVNDVVLAVAGGALRAYLEERGELPSRSLVAGVPVSSDQPGDVARLGGNKVSNLFTTLATDREDPRQRLAAIHEVTAEAKVQQNLLGVELMQDWVQYTPPGPYAFAVRQFSDRGLADQIPPAINVVVSNVPGPRQPLFVGGAQLRHIYSVGPILEGIGLNLTFWSYVDSLDVGVIACRDAVPDPHRITDLLRAALDELLALADAAQAAAETEAGAG